MESNFDLMSIGTLLVIFGAFGCIWPGSAMVAGRTKTTFIIVGIVSILLGFAFAFPASIKNGKINRSNSAEIVVKLLRGEEVSLPADAFPVSLLTLRARQMNLSPAIQKMLSERWRYSIHFNTNDSSSTQVPLSEEPLTQAPMSEH